MAAQATIGFAPDENSAMEKATAEFKVKRLMAIRRGAPGLN
jgi:hypothetical protein